jgi:multidrug resistance efflux pump
MVARKSEHSTMNRSWQNFRFDKELSIRIRPYSPRLLSLLGLAALITCALGALPALVPNLRSENLEPEHADSPPRQSVVCFGYSDAEHGVTPLYPLAPGRVVKVEVRESQSVKAGTVLVRLDDRLARLRLQEAEADLEAAQAQLLQAEKAPRQHDFQLIQQRAAIQAAKARLAAGRIALDHKQDLHKAKYLTATELEAAKALMQELEAAESAEIAKLDELQLVDPSSNVRRARADVNAKQARLAQARQGIEECNLLSPCAGAILRIHVSPGEVLGSQAQRPAVVFLPEGPRWIRVDVNQEFAGLLAPGQTATIEDASGAPGTWRGKVERVSDWYAPRRSLTPDLFHTNEPLTLECLVQLDPNQPSLAIGRRMRVTIEAALP